MIRFHPSEVRDRAQCRRWVGRSIALLAAIVAAGPLRAADTSKQRTVSVVTSEYQFNPKKLAFRRGIAYRLHIENRGKETHEFTAPDFFKAVAVRNPEALNADRTEIVVQPGEAKDLDFVPKRAGRFELRCSDHDWAGMTGGIEIK